MKHEPRNSGTKVCKKCGQEKHALGFSVDRDNRDGLHSWCRECCQNAAAGHEASKYKDAAWPNRRRRH